MQFLLDRLRNLFKFLIKIIFLLIGIRACSAVSKIDKRVISLHVAVKTSDRHFPRIDKNGFPRLLLNDQFSCVGNPP